MIDDDYNYETRSVAEELIIMLWISVGIIGFIVPLLALALKLG